MSDSTLPRMTVFAAPRAFTGEFEHIQRNAVASWLAIEPRPEVILLGRDEGVEAACASFGIRWIPDIEAAASGAPMLDSVFAAAQAAGSCDLMAYINPDVIVPPEFTAAVELASSMSDRFGLVAAPWNVIPPVSIEGPVGSWAPEVARLAQGGTPPKLGADVFVFPRFSLDPVPTISIGRLGWDNWLLWRMATASFPVIDISEAVVFVHQDHGGSTHRGSLAGTNEAFGSDVVRNSRTIRRRERMTRRSDMPYSLGPDFAMTRHHRLGAIDRALRVSGRWLRLRAKPVIARTAPLRPLLRLYRDN